MASGWVTDEASAAEWLLGLLEHALATLDLPVLRRLHRRLARRRSTRGSMRWTAWLARLRARRARCARRIASWAPALARVLSAVGVTEAARLGGARRTSRYAAMFALATAR